MLPGDLERIFPICTPGASDTARFDEALELLNLAGRPLHHAILMMIPEAWENHESMDADRKAFYRYHASLMEPWDGPASIAFTDGTVIGAVLDRNGLRPSRYWVTDDDRVIMATEVGVLDVPPEQDRAQGPARAREDLPRRHDAGPHHPRRRDQGRARGARSRTRSGSTPGSCTSTTCRRSSRSSRSTRSAVQQQRMFGYTQEDLRLIIAPMARNAVESLGSMGTDTPVPVISDRPRMLYEYFKQLFAQVTNPPLDANFEALVTSLNSTLGPEGNLLAPDAASCRQIVCPSPILTNEELAKLRYIDDGDYAVPGFTPFTVYCHFPVAEGGDGLRMAIDNVRTQVSEAIADGANLIILSDRYADAENAPIPALLATVGRAPPSRAREDAHARRPHRRDGRGARGAPLRAAARVRRGRHQPLPRVRHDPRPGEREGRHRVHGAQGDQELREGGGQGHPQGDVEDGHLDGRVVHRRADLRGGRPRPGSSSTSTSPAPRRASRASTST